MKFMNESRELGKGIALSARSVLIGFPCEMSVPLPRYVNSEREIVAENLSPKYETEADENLFA